MIIGLPKKCRPGAKMIKKMNKPASNEQSRARRFLERLHFSCAEDAFVSFRQNILKEWVFEAAQSYENGLEEFKDYCLALLNDDNVKVIEGAISCLFVIGNSQDIKKIEPFTSFENQQIQKAAKTCIFEIKKRKR